MLCGNFRRSIDKHGRIYIPKKLRNDFGKEKVVVIGYKDHVEQLETKKALDKIR
ncbi:MAG: hypothetical protein UV65_C0015G0002 [Parcubacteria group bacterium GW2011_GWF2_43_11]|nr:MAG: hypothetical protein UV65_C0015G0002 [Parcubacteria group bacterium GW2011_GWF2_43_11]